MLALSILVSVTVVGSGTGLLEGALTYMPIFGIGVLLAYCADSLESRAARLRPKQWAALGALGIVLITLPATANWISGPASLGALEIAFPVVGAMIIVFISAWCPSTKGFLEARPIQWLGLISFSLYVIHEPIVVGIAFMAPGMSLALVLLFALPLSLLAAELFYRTMERPSHLLSRRIGRTPRNENLRATGTAPPM